MQKTQIIRNIHTAERFFEIIKSMPNPQMNLYSGYIFSPTQESPTITEAKNKDGICLYRYVDYSNSKEFESVFKALKRNLNA